MKSGERDFGLATGRQPGLGLGQWWKRLKKRIDWKLREIQFNLDRVRAFQTALAGGENRSSGRRASTLITLPSERPVTETLGKGLPRNVVSASVSRTSPSGASIEPSRSTATEVTIVSSSGKTSPA